VETEYQIANPRNKNFVQPKPVVNELTMIEKNWFGLDEDHAIIVNTVEDLKKNIQNIVVAEALIDTGYQSVGYTKKQKFVKNQKYVMSLGTYQMLKFDQVSKVKILRPSQKTFKKIYKPYTGQNLTNKSLLLWRQGGIGDLLFISPNLIFLKETYKNCKIIFACGPQYQSMIREWDFIDEVVDLPFNASYMFKSDYHITFEGVIERTREAESENCYKLFSKWMGLNLPDELLIPKQKPSQESLDKTDRILRAWLINDQPFILIQMRSSSPIRTPRPKFWKNIIDGITERKINVILSDLPQMSNDIDNFINTLNFKHRVFNFSQYSFEIADAVAMTSKAKMVVAVDSSIIHIAESLGIKSLGIYGAFPGDVRLSTYKHAEWIDAKAPCAPCFKHGTILCKNSSDGYVNCYDNIKTNEVLERVFCYV